SIPKMPIRLQMLVNNQVSAALLPDPLASLAQKQGAKVIIDDTTIKDNVSQVVLIFRKDSIDSKKEEIRKLIKIYGQAGSDLTVSPDKYKALVFEKAKIPVPIKETYKSPTFSSPQAPSEKDVNNVVNWMVEKKLLDKPYTYEELVDKSLI
ncbi:MAG TPA: metal ABC transporter substrate-binding protein, partial [Desulfobacteria bacterium]|nr:metal ABC transporter substrate-binding protein [Desulfobacteria bacterium]